MSLSYFQVLLTFILYLFVMFPAGYLGLFLFGKRNLKHVDATFILVSGLTMWLLLSFALALMGQLHNLFVFIVLSEWAIFGLFLVCKTRREPSNRASLFVHFRRAVRKLARFALFMSLLLASMSYFAYFAWQMQWAPPGDAVVHSTITALMIETGGLATPQVQESRLGFVLHEFTFGYPPGFHLLASMMSALTGVFPGEATVLTSAFISSLMPLVVFSIVFNLSKSKKWSTVGYMLTFLLPNGEFSTWPQHDLLTANLLNGTYMAHAGNLLLLFLVLAFVTEEFSFPVYWMAVFGLILTYTGYVSYALLWALEFLIRIMWTHRSSNSNSVVRTLFSDKWKAVNLVGFVMIAIVPIAFPNEFSFILATMREYSPVYRIYGDWLPASLLFPNLLLVLCCVFSSLALLLSKTEMRLSMIYFSAILIVLGSLHEAVYSNMLFTTYPQRFFPVFIAMGYCVLIVFLANASNIPWFRRLRSAVKWPDYRYFALQKRTKQTATIVLSLLIAVAVFLPYVLYRPSPWGRPTGADYEVLAWISKNLPEDQIILNDRTFAGLYLTAFSPKHVVNTFPMPLPALPRANELNQIFDDPGDYRLANRLFSKYEVKYLFVSSESEYMDLFSGGWRYKRLAARDYLTLFELNPYLTDLYSEGESAVYRILSEPSWLKSIIYYPLLGDYRVLTSGAATVEIDGGNVSIIVNNPSEYGGVSFTLHPPQNASGAIIHLKASAAGLNRQRSIHGYVSYKDASSVYFHTNLDAASYNWTGFASLLAFDQSKEIDNIEVNIGMLWSGYVGSLDLSDITVVWRLS